MTPANRILIRMLVTQLGLKIFNTDPEVDYGYASNHRLQYVLHNVLNQPTNVFSVSGNDKLSHDTSCPLATGDHLTATGTTASFNIQTVLHKLFPLNTFRWFGI